MKNFVLALFAVSLFLVLFTIAGEALSVGSLFVYLKGIILSVINEIKLFFGVFFSADENFGFTDFAVSGLFVISMVLVSLVMASKFFPEPEVD